jgi:dTDP-4-amino-4,6-dideoxygalactose transaminase
VQLDHTDAEQWPILTAEDEAEVLRVMRDGDLSCHPVIGELEDAYCQRFNRRHALAHCNGTAALLAAFFALDLHPGDEIIVPSATWWASVSPMCWLGLVPVFADCEMERCGLCPADVKRKITPRTKAIVVVHLWGLPAKLTELRRIAEEHNLAIVEDASHAHGATWRGEPCGGLGDVSVFSLQGQKLAPAGEGGVLLTDRDDLIERAKSLGDVVRISELETSARRFAATGFGMKTRIAPLSAAVAKVQLRHLDARNAQRNANVEYLAEKLENLGFHTFRPPPHVGRVYFEFLVRNDPIRTGIETVDLIERTRAHGLHVRPARYPLLHQQPFFTEGHAAQLMRLPPSFSPPDYAAVSLPNVEAAAGECFMLPPFHRAERALLDAYADVFESVGSPRP